MFGLAAFLDKQIMSMLLGKFSLSESIEGALDHIGEEVINEFMPNALGREVLNKFRPEELGKGVIEKGLERIFSGEQSTDRRGGPQWRQAKWQRGGWAASREQWLNEGWKHDWRSQPRDAQGRWIRGRLSYNVAPDWSTSRRVKEVRKFRRKYRKAGRQAVKGYYSSWGRTDGR